MCNLSPTIVLFSCFCTRVLCKSHCDKLISLKTSRNKVDLHSTQTRGSYSVKNWKENLLMGYYAYIYLYFNENALSNPGSSSTVKQAAQCPVVKEMARLVQVTGTITAKVIYSQLTPADSITELVKIRIRGLKCTCILLEHKLK